MLLARIPGRRVAAVASHMHVLSCVTYPLIVILSAGLSTISTLAHSNPPDSGGPPGIYDNADYDDVVAVLTDTVGVGISLLARGRPECCCFGVASFRSPAAPHDASLLSLKLRSPPIT